MPFKERDDDLVPIQRFVSSTAAHSLRILLEAHGIQAAVVNEESTSTLGTNIFGNQSPIGIEVCVQRQHVEDATLIMNEVPAAAEALIPEWVCKCGETVDAGFSVCWSCGAKHPEE